jgi:hypothetical protein
LEPNPATEYQSITIEKNRLKKSFKYFIPFKTIKKSAFIRVSQSESAFICVQKKTDQHHCKNKLYLFQIINTSQNNQKIRFHPCFAKRICVHLRPKKTQPTPLQKQTIPLSNNQYFPKQSKNPLSSVFRKANLRSSASKKNPTNTTAKTNYTSFK